MSASLYIHLVRTSFSRIISGEIDPGVSASDLADPSFLSLTYNYYRPWIGLWKTFTTITPLRPFMLFIFSLQQVFSKRVDESDYNKKVVTSDISVILSRQNL